jgi:hypothetical protein
MEQLKFSIGPYELFSSVIAGIPLLLAGFMLYHPISSLRDLVPIIVANSSWSIFLTLGLLSYILSGMVQGVTWRFFKALCRVFKVDYGHIGNVVIDRMNRMARDQGKHPAEIVPKEFEDRLALLLLNRIGDPKKLSSVDERLMPYVRKYDSQSAAVAESYMAIHIMYRNLSFGFLVLALAFVVNFFRIKGNIFEQSALPLLCLASSYLSIERSAAFKGWRLREILLSFYHLAAIEDVSRKQQTGEDVTARKKENELTKV